MIKKIFKSTVVAILTWESKLVLKKFKPRIIGVTGSVGKTSTKEVIYSIFEGENYIRKSEKSYNSELGLPLTILGCTTAWNNPIGWLKNILIGLYIILFERHYPTTLILEVGADRPGDIKKVVKWVKFDVAVITRLPDVPVHVEFFPTKEDVIKEKKYLPKSVGAEGVVIMNADDPNMSDLLAEFDKRSPIERPKIIKYGINEECDFRASNINIIYQETGDKKTPEGLTFKLDYDGNSVPVKVYGALGKHQVYQSLAALAAGYSQGVNMVTMIERLSKHGTPPGRLRLIEGIKDSFILDDTYNSSPAAVDAALETLKSVETRGRRIAVLGDMMELGSFTKEMHMNCGKYAAQVCDLLFTVGLRAKYFADGAREAGMTNDRIKQFGDSISAGEVLQNIIEPGDLVLVKGSQYVRMEKAVEEIMAKPEEAEKLLVRQDPEWKRR